jgi:hypothetical protein
VVWDLSTTVYVDIAGVRMLQAMADQLSARGIAMRVAEAHGDVRDLVARQLGHVATGTTVRRSVSDVIAEHGATLTQTKPAAPA